MRFVVHEHNSTGPSGLHHDLRIEHMGVLKSWAIPKLVEPRTKAKRLAIRVADHDIRYIGFQGEIKEGYGAGTVSIWDSGTYTFVKEPKEGVSYKIRFNGSKLNGIWILRQMNLNTDNFLFFRGKES